MSTAPVYGLILAGGSSERMHSDKAALVYRGQKQLDRAYQMVCRHAAKVFVSVRASQAAEPTRARHPLLVDSAEEAGPGAEGPMVGIRSALAAFPDVAWLVVACDLPFLSDTTLERLLAERDPALLATAFRSAHDGLPEPLCAIWEPAARAVLAGYQNGGRGCPRKFLIAHSVKLIVPNDLRALDNVNTPEEYAEAQDVLGGT